MATARSTRASRGQGGTRARTRSEVIEIDFDDYEESEYGEYMGDDPRPGVYEFDLINVQKHVAQSSGNEGIKWMFACREEPYAGWLTSMYSDTNPEGSKWKSQQIVKAVTGGSTDVVKLDLKNPKKFLDAAQPVLGRVVSDSWQDEDTGEVRTSSKLRRVVALEGANTGGKKRKLADDEEYDDEGFEEDEEGYEEDDAEADEEDDAEADDGYEEEDDAEAEEEEPEEPAPARRRRAAPAKKAAPAKRAAAKKASPAARRATRSSR